MSIVFLAPAGLAFLGALLVPILLHLARRRRAEPTPFAALRWLAPGAPPRSRVQLEELLLLALRLLLLALLALWLAQPVWRDAPARSGAHVVVVPGVDYAATLDAMPPGAEARWLTRGFPEFDGKPPAVKVPVSSLLREFDASLAPGATLTAIVPDALAGLDAERIRLVHPVDWRVVRSMPEPATTPARAPVLLAVRYGPAAEGTLKYFSAAITAWNTTEPDRFRLDAQPWGAPIAKETTWMVGLDGAPDAAALAWIEAGGTALIDADPREVVQAGGRSDAAAPLRVRRRGFAAGTVVLPSSPLRTGRAELLDAAFPATLRRWLEGPAPPPDRVRAEFVAPLSGAAPTSPPGRPLAPWLALAVALVFFAERVLANGPRLGRAR